METLSVECLRCGEKREVTTDAVRHVGECSRCGYLGWAHSSDLTERARRALRERPMELRRLRAVW